MKQQQRLTPSGIDLGPVHGLRRKSSQSEPIDRSKVSVVRDAKRVIVDVGFVELFKLPGVVVVFEVDAILLVVKCLKSLLELVAFLPIPISQRKNVLSI